MKFLGLPVFILGSERWSDHVYLFTHQIIDEITKDDTHTFKAPIYLPAFQVDRILQRKPLKDGTKNSEELLQGTDSLKKDGVVRKEKYDVETISMHCLQLENEDLKEEISDNRYDLTSSFERFKFKNSVLYYFH